VETQIPPSADEVLGIFLQSFNVQEIKCFTYGTTCRRNCTSVLWYFQFTMSVMKSPYML